MTASGAFADVLRRGRALYGKHLRILVQAFQTRDRASLLHERRLAGFKIHIAEVHLLFALLRYGHCGDNDVDVPVFQHVDPGLEVTSFSSTLVSSPRIFGQRFGDVDIEALHIAGRWVLQSKQLRIIFHPGYKLAPFLDRLEGVRIAGTPHPDTTSMMTKASRPRST